MPVLTVDVDHLEVGALWDGQSLRGWVVPYVLGFITDDGLSLGKAPLDFDPTGLATVELPSTADTGVPYRLHILYRDTDGQGKQYFSFWFNFILDSDFQDVTEATELPVGFTDNGDGTGTVIWTVVDNGDGTGTITAA